MIDDLHTPLERAGQESCRPEATITPYPDGPLLVRGNFRLLDHEGNVIPLGRPTVALCRCGRSRMRPFCDGTHRLVGFRAPGALEGVKRPIQRRVQPPDLEPTA